MELKDVVNKTLKTALKANGFTTRGADFWKEIDGGHLMIHLKKSIYNNGANGFNSEVSIFAITSQEMTSDISHIWMDYQVNHLTLRDLVPEYGYFTEGMKYVYLDFNLHSKCPMSGKEYEVKEWVTIVDSIFNEYLIPFLDSISSFSEFERIKKELIAKRTSKDIRIYSFYSSVMKAGMYKENVQGFAQCFWQGAYSLEEALKNINLLDRFLNLYSDSWRKAYEKQIRDFVDEVLALAEENAGLNH